MRKLPEIIKLIFCDILIYISIYKFALDTIIFKIQLFKFRNFGYPIFQIQILNPITYLKYLIHPTLAIIIYKFKHSYINFVLGINGNEIMDMV